MDTNPNNEDRTALVAGYVVELSFDTENDGHVVSSCFVSKGSYSSSLAMVHGCGGYENEYGEFRPISEQNVDKIYAWAESNGY